MKFKSAFIFCLAFSFLPALCQAITLTDTSTGLSLNAPAGYSLSQKGGFYTLKGKRSSAHFMRARSPLDVSSTVDSFIKLSKIKTPKKKKQGSGFKVSGKLGGKPVIVQFTPVGDAIDIATFKQTSKKPNKAKARVRSPFAAGDVTIADIAVLQRALNSRTGGLIVPLNLAIPMKKFTAPDGGSSALVPDLPGWAYQGGGGVIAGANAAQGIISLGVPVLVNLPNPFGLPVPPPKSNVILPPDQAIVSAWPQYVAVTANVQVQVLGIQVIPGTEGFLGSNRGSAMFAVRFAMNGRNWSALFSSGSNEIPDLYLGWYWYHSYIAVPEDGPGGIGAALIDSWASWDNSGASQARLNQALQTLLSIRGTGGPIDPDVFQKAANDWSDYIRE